MPTSNASTSMDSSTEADATNSKGKKKKDPKAYQALTIANTIADGVTLDDAYSSVCDALKENGYGTYIYIVVMTTSVVVFQMYNMFQGEYDTYQMSYSVDAQGNVTFGNDMTEVRLMTSIVPVNEPDSTSAADTGEANMPTANTKPGGTTSPVPAANATEKKPEVVTLKNDQGTLEITSNEKGEQSFSFTPNKASEPVKAQTAEEYIKAAPSAFQEVLQSSLKLHEDSKKAAIKALKDSGRCKFSDDKLNAMSLGDLQDLIELANVPSYEGRALPVTNSSQEELGYTPAPLVFEAPKAA